MFFLNSDNLFAKNRDISTARLILKLDMRNINSRDMEIECSFCKIGDDVGMTDAKVKLLYVDDEEMNLYLFKEQFKQKYDVVTALSGLGGLQELGEDAEIQVVISDMTMPAMNGLDLIRRAKSQRNELLCFLLTGIDLYQEAKNAVASKLIEGYFVKPYQASQIDQIIQEALKGRKL